MAAGGHRGAAIAAIVVGAGVAWSLFSFQAAAVAIRLRHGAADTIACSISARYHEPITFAALSPPIPSPAHAQHHDRIVERTARRLFRHACIMKNIGLRGGNRH